MTGPGLIQQTAVYLREKLGVDLYPNGWTRAQWASANNARLTSRLHAQTADFRPIKPPMPCVPLLPQ